ncbi:lysophospholipid acyltransferase family protein [Schleiferia thermophila]|uniref:lysophospholipid acyltransferase family protein n=1 Tax=Schleiferia thermophila TaxID=884107 RepID=UPI0004E7320D|nr:lysophospholipid acyltransferase family protein [Schleiferia thermophila]KFD40334.1 hypothetical protein AT05_01850 [Schleiferia thermophila str. Yellowstone]
MNFISKLPLTVLYFLTSLVIRFYKYRKKVVEANLKIAFPYKSEEERKTLRENFYIYFSELIAENLKDFNPEYKENFKFVNINNLQIFEHYYIMKRRIMLMLGHHGNFEYLSILPALIPQNIYAVYGELKNKKIEKDFLRKRGKFGLKLFPMKETYTFVERNMDQTAVYGFIADQSPHEGRIHHRSKFFAEDTPTHVGAEKLAKMYNMVVIYLNCEKVSRGKYEYTPVIITENPRELPDFEITDRYNQLLEASIKKQPEIYLWTHKRWKHLRPGIYV